MSVQFQVNGKPMTAASEGSTPLLWVLRDELGMTGTKFGCGAALCGACTVHLDGVAVRACQVQASELEGANIVTIEGLGTPAALHPVQAAWIETQVAQCGYCQSGQIMQAASMLSGNPSPTDDEIDAAMSGNLCRCGSYPRVRAAIRLAITRMEG